MLKGSYSFGVRVVNNLVFLGQKSVPKLSGQLTGLLDYRAQVIGVREPDISALKVRSVGLLKFLPTLYGVFGKAI